MSKLEFYLYIQLVKTDALAFHINLFFQQNSFKNRKFK